MSGALSACPIHTLCDNRLTESGYGAEPATAPGSGGLKYQSAQSGYHFNWQTSKAWAMTCRRFDIELSDGGIYSAWFDFT